MRSFWWLGLARKDLERAQRARKDKDKVSMVFWSQQSIEKTLEALALSVKRDIPKTHNIRRLREFIGETLGLPEEIWEKAYELTRYYYVSRYPDIVKGIPDEVISIGTANEAVDIAEEIIKAAERRIKDESNGINPHVKKIVLDFKNRIERELGIKISYILFSAQEHVEIIEKIVILT